MHALRLGFMPGPRPGAQLARPALGQHPDVSAREREAISLQIVDAANTILGALADLQYHRDLAMEGDIGEIPLIGPFLSKGEIFRQLKTTAARLAGAAVRLEQAAGPYATTADRALIAESHEAIMRFEQSLPAGAAIAPVNEIFSEHYTDFLLGEPSAAISDLDRLIVTAEASGLPGPEEPVKRQTSTLLALGALAGIGYAGYILYEVLQK